MHALCELLSVVAGLASLLAAAMAFNIQRDRRFEKSLEAKFEKELGEFYDPLDKDPTWQPDPDRREALLERQSATLSGCEATRYRNASTFWMLATGCALAAAVMLYLLYLRVV